MNLPEEFLPIDGPPTLKSNYIQYGIALLIFELITLFVPMDIQLHQYFAAAEFLFILIIVITDSSALSVTISQAQGTFTYRTMNWLGNEKDTIVDIPTAKISYKYTLIAKGTWGWRLRLYNNYFGNRIRLKENNGFNKDQLDQMNALIVKCKIPVT
jgi:hypothetical protein